MIPTVGAVAFTEHWLHPALMVLPIFLFALAERGAPTPGSCRAYLALLGVVVMRPRSAPGSCTTSRGADHCGRCRDLVPFAALAAQLRAAGFERGTIVTDDPHIGGNLRVLFPASRVLDPAYPSSIWPAPTGHSQCLAVWRGDAGAGPTGMSRQLEAALGVPADAGWRAGRIEAAMSGSATRRYALGYELLDPGPGECR